MEGCTSRIQVRTSPNWMPRSTGREDTATFGKARVHVGPRGEMTAHKPCTGDGLYVVLASVSLRQGAR
eukprot:2147493-Pyramimonas_sp.AAC.1